MKKVQIITKPDCSRCQMLKDWLDMNHVIYVNWNIANKEIQKK